MYRTNPVKSTQSSEKELRGWKTNSREVVERKPLMSKVPHLATKAPKPILIPTVGDELKGNGDEERDEVTEEEDEEVEDGEVGAITGFHREDEEELVEEDEVEETALTPEVEAEELQITAVNPVKRKRKESSMPDSLKLYLAVSPPCCALSSTLSKFLRNEMCSHYADVKTFSLFSAITPSLYLRLATLQEVGARPLLSSSEELVLGREVQRLMHFESQKAVLMEEMGTTEVTTAQWAEKVNLPVMEFDFALSKMRWAKRKMVESNLRLVSLFLHL